MQFVYVRITHTKEKAGFVAKIVIDTEEQKRASAMPRISSEAAAVTKYYVLRTS